MIRTRPVQQLIITLTAVLLALGAGACSRQVPVDEYEEVNVAKTTFSFDKEEAPFDIFTEYHVAPGDVLDVLYHVNTWSTDQTGFTIQVDNEVTVKFVDLPDLTETQMVRPDGKISLPYLGSVQVVGKTVDQLTEELRQQYSTILRNPEVWVLVPEFRSAIREFKNDLHTAPRGLSRLVTVRPDGYATFAMVGDHYCEGKTVPEISRELNEKYKDVLFGMSVDLFLHEHQSAQVYVLGEVNEPGAYNIMKFTSVIEAIALANGNTPFANMKEVVVNRRLRDRVVATKVNVANMLFLGGEQDEDDEEQDEKDKLQYFYLKPDDVIYVPRRRAAKWADVARDIGDIIFFRGWGFNVGASYGLGNRED